MPPLELLALFGGCVVIGGVSALLGLGGGLFLVPALTFALGLEIREAAGVSLVAALATSAAGSIALDKARLADLPIVSNLELAAALGGITGAVLAAALAPQVIAGAFAVVMTYTALRMVGRTRQGAREEAGRDAYPVRYPLGLLGCFVAGSCSGMLGIGGGPIKVPVQSELMRVPLRVALANSNLMVGMTAGASAALYYANGFIDGALVAPSALGIAAGAYAGGRLAPRIDPQPLRYAFSGVLVLVAVRMVWKALAPDS